jgi:hypothetical protein
LRQDLILAMAWKIGLIDHIHSEVTQQIVYQQNWPTALRDRYGHQFSASISYLAAQMPTILTHIAQGNPQYLFNLSPRLQGFGRVYILAVLFFATHGSEPIYDRFAHIAALAIHQGLAPGSPVKCKAVEEWNDYQQYKNLLLPISKAFPQRPGTPSMFVSRPVDRALWVYGHFFEMGEKACSTTKPVRTYPQVSTQSGHLKGELVGRICDLSNATSDGWRRREINVKHAADGYPAVRDIIHLIDSSGAKYPGLPFVKGARLPGHTCLGKPGALRPWFARHYSADRVEAESVYFKPTGQPNEYRIYTKSEWKASTNIDG